MPTEAEKIERIDMSEKEIENSLKDFFKKYDLVLKKKSEKGFIWGNDEYNLNFIYGLERYYWFVPQGLNVEIKNKTYSFSNIFYFIQWNQNLEYLDFHKTLISYRKYAKYLELRLIPFLNMDNNIEKIEAFLEKPPWNK